MIHLVHKKDCCGCSACVQRCPKHCIEMKEDEEGFLYPYINAELCIDCGICEKVCPVLNQSDVRLPISTYAAINPNENVRLKSSSGGIFSMLSELIINEGGVVFGVGYNKNWEVVHGFTESKSGLDAFRASKYVQSIVGNAYKDVEVFLKQGRKVLFSGTPCQIAGLKRFLRKSYDNLLTVDFICHGTPSPGVFRWYLGEEIAKCAHVPFRKNSMPKKFIPFIDKPDVLAKRFGFKIKDIRFRDKRNGWRKYCFVLELIKISNNNSDKNVITIYNSLDKNPFLRGFLRNLYLRPSCHDCPAKKLKSGSDITIGDYWKIETIMPDIDDNKGVSAVMVNTDKGNDYLEKISVLKYISDYDILCRLNPATIQSVPWNVDHSSFFKANKNSSFFNNINKYCNPSIAYRIEKKIRKLLRNMFNIMNYK